MFCAPTATLLPSAAAITVGSSTGEGKRAISSRVCPATSGKKASTNALASVGVLYIFQLAAISALRGIFLRLLESIVVDYLRWEGDDGHNTGQRFLLVPHRRCRPAVHETVAPASRPAVAWTSWSTFVSS